MKGKTEAQAAQLAMLRDAFVRLDANGDGFVDAEDLRAVWRTSGVDASERRAVAWVRARDIDADERVAFDEVIGPRRLTLSWRLSLVFLLVFPESLKLNGGRGERGTRL